MDNVKIKDIQRIVSEHFEITIDELTGESRRQEIVFARNIAIYISRQFTYSSLKTIGEKFGKDYSTMIHSLKNIENNFKKDSHTSRHIHILVEEIENLINMEIKVNGNDKVPGMRSGDQHKNGDS